jgi:hypothetical protein
MLAGSYEALALAQQARFLHELLGLLESDSDRCTWRGLLVGVEVALALLGLLPRKRGTSALILT